MFADTIHERNILMEKAYPKLKEYCRKEHGLEFQVRSPPPPLIICHLLDHHSKHPPDRTTVLYTEITRHWTNAGLMLVHQVI